MSIAARKLQRPSEESRQRRITGGLLPRRGAEGMDDARRNRARSGVVAARTKGAPHPMVVVGNVLNAPYNSNVVLVGLRRRRRDYRHARRGRCYDDTYDIWT